jgi:hypothetical protein
MAIDLTDIEHEDGDDNTAGIGQHIYVAKAADIETLPEPIQPSSTGTGSLSDLVTITDPIVMKAGKAFRKVYCTLEKGQLDHEGQGEMDGQSFMNKLKFFIPGTKAEALGFAQWAKNSSLIFLVPELDGQIRLLGHKTYPAKAVPGTGSTGAKSADLKGTEFNFQSARKGPAPIFEGVVQVSGVGSEYDADSNNEQDIIY